MDQCLIETLFDTLSDACKTLEEWQADYNWRRPNSVLGSLTPKILPQGHREKVDETWSSGQPIDTNGRQLTSPTNENGPSKLGPLLEVSVDDLAL